MNDAELLNRVVISLASPEYEKSLFLREEVLLAPFGIELKRAQADDGAAHHLGLFSRNECVACLLLIEREEATLQMRQVAVRENLQRKGYGRALVDFAEEWGKMHGFRFFWANARETALPFYQSLNYRVVGARFTQVGLPHFRVEKEIV